MGVDVELQPGREAVVRVPVATLWTAPEAVRPVDRPALTAPADITAWIGGMDRDQQVGNCVLSQLLLGERVLVTEQRADGWAHVVALEQPAARRDPRGYPGWLPAAQLTPPRPERQRSPQFVVDALVADLHATPGGAPALAGVVLGTRLHRAGPQFDGWLPCHVPGHTDPLWIQATDVVPVPVEQPEVKEVIAVADRLRDLVYIWGGRSSHGIDCSGLVQLAWRRFGVTLPRDSPDQAESTTPLPLNEERPGDLYFFARPGRPIHHVGIVTAEPHGDRRRMLHACYQQRRVVEEQLPADRLATLVAVHRV
ncbi:NlpC/P60 family protein [Micromonospora sp. MS34]|uniref:C40 family peptidase n=1 Tax=Micromonospora sp. MS34 TaxID=3385971 RepID=UPI0039A14592